jgi:hypothetical protein
MIEKFIDILVVLKLNIVNNKIELSMNSISMECLPQWEISEIKI